MTNLFTTGACAPSPVFGRQFASAVEIEPPLCVGQVQHLNRRVASVSRGRKLSRWPHPSPRRVVAPKAPVRRRGVDASTFEEGVSND